MNTPNYLVIHADDCAQQHCCNVGILRAYQNGVLTSTCVRANGMALDEALNEILPACPNLGVGAHICLNEGRAVSPLSRNTLLADKDGNFRYIAIKGYMQLYFLGYNRKLREQVKTEMRAQVEVLARKCALDHLNGHYHIHNIPWIFDIAVEVAEEYTIPFIRIPREPLHMSAFAKHTPSLLHCAHYLSHQWWALRNYKRLHGTALRVNDSFYGLLHSSAMWLSVVEALLVAHKTSKDAITEILLHPALSDEAPEEFMCDVAEEFCTSPDRQLEYDALIAPELRVLLQGSKYVLTNFRELAKILS